MGEQAPHLVLKALVRGVDPATGEAFTPATVLQQAEVQRALLAGIAALEQDASRAQRRAQQPGNIGRLWTSAEEQQLTAEFHAGHSLADIAGRHGRTLAAIEARLELLGLLTAEQRVTRNRYASAKAGSRMPSR